MEKRENHSAVELADALEHVIYEIWKYKESIALYRKLVGICGEAAVEFRVLHNWSLLEFFFGPPRQAGRIVASDYISDWDSTHDRAALAWLDPYVERCHTMLSPISTERVAMGNTGLKHWNQDWPEIDPHIDKSISEFLGGLSDEHKTICLKWTGHFLQPGKPGSMELAGLVTALGRVSS